MRLTRLCTALGLLPWMAFAATQDGMSPKTTKGVTPVELAVSPPRTVPGAPVTLKGTTAFTPSNKVVAITVRFKPDAGVDESKLTQAQRDFLKPKPLAASVLDSAGTFQIAFKDTDVPGTYEVIAESPDKKGRATAEFEVMEIEDLDEDAEDALSRTLYAARKAEEVATAAAESLPPSPGKDDLHKKLKALKEKLTQSKEREQKVKQALGTLQDAVSKHPQTGIVFRPIFAGAAEWSAEAREDQQRITKELDQLKRKTHSSPCDAIDDTVDAVRLMGTALEWVTGKFKSEGYNPLPNRGAKPPTPMAESAKKGLLDKLTGFLEKAPDAINNTLGDKPENKNAVFVATEAVKVARNLIAEPQSWSATLIGAARDTAEFAIAEQFGKYCERFEGPLRASFTADFFHQGKKYWAYTMELDGRLVLRYSKGDTGRKTWKVTGQYEGSASKFTLFENFILIDPSLKGNRVFHRAVAPPGLPFDKGAPKAVNFLKPTSFYIPVEGEMTADGKVTLRMLAPQKDLLLKALQGRVVNIFVEPITLVPEVVVTDTPYQSAHFILSRSIGDEREYAYVVDKARKQTRIDRDFVREYKDPAGGFVVTWKVSVHATNPPPKG